MPPIFSALTELVLMAVYAALWVSGLILLVIGFLKKRRAQKIVGWVFIFLALVMTALNYWGEYRAHSPRYVYEETFHEKPPSDVIPLFGEDTSNWAASGIELRVKADRAGFDRLLQRIQDLSEPKLQRLTLEQYNQLGPRPSRPKEMEVPKEDAGIYVSYERFGAEYVELTYAPETQVVQFYWYDGD